MARVRRKEKVAVIDMFIFLGHVWGGVSSAVGGGLCLLSGSAKLGHWASVVGRGLEGKLNATAVDQPC